MKNRDLFKSRMGFILASAGAAIGLGNIWRFPFEVANGGGAIFFLLYLAISLLICWPILLSESVIGRASQKNAVGAYEAIGHRKWRFLGLLGVITAVLILSFYNVIAGWAFGYFLEMLQGHFDVGQRFGEVINDIFYVGLYAICFMIATAFVVARGVSRGIERLSRIMMPVLLGIIIFLGIYALTLPHAMHGLKFYLLPDFSALSLEVVYGAVGHAFFSLSLGMGAMVTYGSYLSKNEDVVKASIFITLADVAIAFFAGIMIFPLVAFQHAGDMSDLQAGPSLIFVTLPGIFAALGSVWGVVVGSIFFLLICFAAFTSTISLLEIPVAYFIDELHIKRRTATFLLALIILLLGIPSAVSFGDSDFYTHFVSYIGSDTQHAFIDFLGHIADASLTLGGGLLAIFVTYVWRKDKFLAAIEPGAPYFKSSFLARYVHFALSYLCPILVCGVFLLRIFQQFFGISFF